MEIPGHSFIVGLTPSDVIRLQNGGVIMVNPKNVGLVDIPIYIGIAKSPEKIDLVVEKHKGNLGVDIKWVDSDPTAKN